MNIENQIYKLRNQRVMMDSDLAELYQVETKILNQAVRRNLDRFPEDFMFECNSDELNDLRSQFVTANPLTNWNHKRRSSPMMFTEPGVAMLSSVLNSERAIHINISIIRIFIKLRSFHALANGEDDQLKKLEKNTHKLFKIVFERMDSIEEQLIPRLSTNRKKIGLK